MKDIYGNKIEVGDRVAYTSARSNAILNLGEVVGYCKNGKDAVRIRVDMSSRARRRSRDPSTGEYKQLPYEGTVTTVWTPSRIAVVGKAVPEVVDLTKILSESVDCAGTSMVAQAMFNQLIGGLNSSEVSKKRWKSSGRILSTTKGQAKSWTSTSSRKSSRPCPSTT